jgi:hypothetical protein
MAREFNNERWVLIMADPVYKNSRPGLDWIASMLPDSLGGTVVKAKVKKKKRLEKEYEKTKKD